MVPRRRNTPYGFIGQWHGATSTQKPASIVRNRWCRLNTLRTTSRVFSGSVDEAAVRTMRAAEIKKELDARGKVMMMMTVIITCSYIRSYLFS